MKKAIIGIDQSYTNTGMCIIVNKKVKNAINVDLSKFNSDPVKRHTIKHKLTDIVGKCVTNGFEEIQVWIEQTRINQGQTTFSLINRQGALQGAIEDQLYKLNKTYKHVNIRLFTVPTISWKTRFADSRDKQENDVGIPPEKYLTCRKVSILGYEKFCLKECSKQTKKPFKIVDGIKYKFDHDIADCIGIGMYAFETKDTKGTEVNIQNDITK